MGGWDGRDYGRIAIDPALPCSFAGCGRPATYAVAERDDAYPELWRLFPVCDACSRRLASPEPDARSGDDPTAFSARL